MIPVIGNAMYFALAGVLAVCLFTIPLLIERRTAIRIVFFAGSLATSLYGFYGMFIHVQGKQHERAIAQAMSALPPGTDEAWTAFVDRRFAGAIQRRGGMVIIGIPSEHIVETARPPKVTKTSEMIFSFGETRISPNTPYEVDCTPELGAAVSFRTGAGGPLVGIYGAWPYLALTPIAIELTEGPPPLGVDKKSILAKQLFERLCGRVSAHMQEIMAPAAIADALWTADAANKRHAYETELKLVRPLAEQGNADAQNRLGAIYAEGRGVSKDDAEASHWYSKAAEQGYGEAQLNLGVLYANGHGVPQDNVRAAMWFRLAEEGGVDEAVLARTYLAASMTPEQIATARAQAATWLDVHRDIQSSR